MLLNGPPIHYSAMRFESKHREMKLAAVTSSNTKYLLKTISIRSQLRLAFIKFNGNIHLNDIQYNKHEIIDEHDRQKYFSSVSNLKTIISTDTVEFKGITYNANTVLVTKIGDDDNLSFGKIIKIFVHSNDIHFLMQN